MGKDICDAVLVTRAVEAGAACLPESGLAVAMRLGAGMPQERAREGVDEMQRPRSAARAGVDGGRDNLRRGMGPIPWIFALLLWGFLGRGTLAAKSPPPPGTRNAVYLELIGGTLAPGGGGSLPLICYELRSKKRSSIRVGLAPRSGDDRVLRWIVSTQHIFGRGVQHVEVGFAVLREDNRRFHQDSLTWLMVPVGFRMQKPRSVFFRANLAPAFAFGGDGFGIGFLLGLSLGYSF